ncbi:MAG: GNAT family N-acetyltransferase [Anaerolineales bacterium]|nr:GNAT family N-acetyltransferase [Anaerolineales bacterium]
MSDQWQVFTEPPPSWEAMCQAERSLFHTPAWQSLLKRSLRASPLFVMQSDGAAAFAVTVFSAGPFRVGYVGFPVGGMLHGAPLTAAQLAELRPLLRRQGIDRLRLVISPLAFGEALPYPAVALPETAVTNLPAWDLNQLSSSIRRNVNKARRSGVQLQDAGLPMHGERLFTLYRQTIARHGGSVRYSAAYFRELASLAGQEARLRCLLAAVDDQIVSFVCVGLDGATAYYLHGATDMAYQHLRPADLLFAAAITWARDEGMAVYNMLASPADQPSLVRYKEKWGGETAPQQTYDLPVRGGRAALFTWATAVFRTINDIKERFKS